MLFGHVTFIQSSQVSPVHLYLSTFPSLHVIVLLPRIFDHAVTRGCWRRRSACYGVHPRRRLLRRVRWLLSTEYLTRRGYCCGHYPISPWHSRWEWALSDGDVEEWMKLLLVWLVLVLFKNDGRSMWLNSIECYDFCQCYYCYNFYHYYY